MDSNIALRHFKMEDAQRCSSLMQDHFLNHATNLPIEVRIQISNSRTSEYIQKIATDRIIIVASLKDKIIGMGALKENEIRHMYVESKYQRRGIGSRIIRFLEREAYEKGFPSIIVNSVDQSEDFYTKNGFQSLIKTRIERHGSILEAILLEKFLDK
ncbi:MAG: GNAT family N-acetyltransferase [Candidatus Heimdallarchaeota archaeon]|nr:MAG: GNAT family N-acetyltransferase [Candidatus Heimdallarchaeota archaeon]